MVDAAQTVAPSDPLGELLPRLTEQEALVEADRCLYCYDAPCTHACPTHIDIPRSSRRSRPEICRGSAETIFDVESAGRDLRPRLSRAGDCAKAPACWALTTSPSPSDACSATRWTTHGSIAVSNREGRADRQVGRSDWSGPCWALLRRRAGQAGPRGNDFRKAARCPAVFPLTASSLCASRSRLPWKKPG